MSEMRAESKGFKIYIGGTWVEISNKYGVLESGDTILPDSIPEDFAEKMLAKFISEHSMETLTPDSFCNVAFDKNTGKYFQLRILKPRNDEYWWVQMFDDELVYVKEEWTGCKYKDEAEDWVRTNYEVVKGFAANVYRNDYGDCTNCGISLKYRKLYILSDHGGPFEPEDIRECVKLEFREIAGERYVNAKPVYFPGRWYMAGGNFLYSSDSRYKELTGLSYPISVHDRYEGSERK